MTDTHDMTSLGQCSTGLSKGESQPLNHQEMEAATPFSHKYFRSHSWKERCKVAMERAPELKEWLQCHQEDSCQEPSLEIMLHGNAHKLKYRKFCASATLPLTRNHSRMGNHLQSHVHEWAKGYCQLLPINSGFTAEYRAKQLYHSVQ